MDNLIFGLEAILKLVSIEISVLYYSSIIRGFFVGYAVASLVYGFIVAGKEKNKITK